MKKAFKKSIALLLLVVMVLSSLTGCGKKDDGKTADGEKTYKVAVITKLQDMYGAWLAAACKAEAAKYDNIAVDAFDFENDETKFLQIMENVAQGSYDLVISQTPKMDARNAIKSVQDSGAIFLHISSAGWEYMRDEELCRLIVCNEYSLGQVVAEKAAEELPQNAKVVVLLGPAGRQNSIDRNQAYHDVMAEKRPDVEFLDEQVANWNKDEAMKKMEDWLQTYDQIDGVLAVNDSMATGAVEALLANGFDDWDNIFISGIDGLTDACTYIEKGYMQCSAIQDATVYSTMAFDLFQKHIKGEIDMNEFEFHEFEPSLITAAEAADQLKYYEEQGLLK